MTFRTPAALAAVLVCAAPLRAQDLAGTWVGGTNVTGTWRYVELHVPADATGRGPTVDVVGEEVAGMVVEGLGVSDGRVAFRIRTPLGVVGFDGTLREDVMDGAVTGLAPHGTMHLVRSFVPPPHQADEAVGAWELDGNQLLLLTHRAFGQLGAFVLDRSRSGERVRRSFYALPSGPDTWVTSGSVLQEVRRDETLTLRRDAAGRVRALDWRARDGSTRSARRVPGPREVSVSFAGPRGHVAGTLFTPDGPGPHPAVVMISGSGPTSRDNLLLRAREFLRLGLAVLTLDKPGVGETDGSYLGASFGDQADDVAAALAFLRGRDGIDSARVGLTGHSQGAWIAPLAAARASTPPAWLVITSGGPITPADQEAWRAYTQARAAGGSEADALAAQAFMRRKWAYASTGEDWAGYLAAAREAMGRPWAGVVSPLLSSDSLAWFFMHSLRDYDPMAVAARLTMPVLVVFAGRDTEQPVEQSRAAWIEAFRRSGHTDHRFVTLPDVGHSLWYGEGSPRPLLTAATDSIGAWLAPRLRR